MDCDRASESISAYLDGELPPETAAAVRAHLDDCPVCLATERDLRALRALLARLPEHRAPAGLAGEVGRQVAGGAALSTHPRAAGARRKGDAAGASRRVWPRVLALAAMLLAAVGIGVLAHLGYFGAEEGAEVGLLSHGEDGRDESIELADAEVAPGGDGAGAEEDVLFRYDGKAADRYAEDLATGEEMLRSQRPYGRLGEVALNGQDGQVYAWSGVVANGGFVLTDRNGRIESGGEAKVGGESLTGDKVVYFDPTRPADEAWETEGRQRLAFGRPATPPARRQLEAPEADAADWGTVLKRDAGDAPAARMLESRSLGTSYRETLDVADARDATASDNLKAKSDAARLHGTLAVAGGAEGLRVAGLPVTSDADARRVDTLVVETESVEWALRRIAAVLRANDLAPTLTEEVSEGAFSKGDASVSAIATRGGDGAGGAGVFTAIHHETEPGYIVVADRERLDRVVAALTSLDAVRATPSRRRSGDSAGGTWRFAGTQNVAESGPAATVDDATLVVQKAQLANELDEVTGKDAPAGPARPAEPPVRPGFVDATPTPEAVAREGAGHDAFQAGAAVETAGVHDDAATRRPLVVQGDDAAVVPEETGLVLEDGQAEGPARDGADERAGRRLARNAPKGPGTVLEVAAKAEGTQPGDVRRRERVEDASDLEALSAGLQFEERLAKPVSVLVIRIRRMGPVDTATGEPAEAATRTAPTTASEVRE